MYEPLVWGTPEARSSEAFKDALWKASEGLIGGTPEEKRHFFEKVSAKWPQCFWIDGSAAPLIKNHVIRFRMKECETCGTTANTSVTL